MKNNALYANVNAAFEKPKSLLPFNKEKRVEEIKKRLLFSSPDIVTTLAVDPNTMSQFTYLHPVYPHCREQLPDVLTPPPSIATAVGAYPQAPVYHLRKDNRYSCGMVYTSVYEVQTKDAHHQRLLAIQTPAACIPVVHEGHYIVQPIPGMVQMIPGIPVAIHLNGDPNHLTTVGCVQTLASLKDHPQSSIIEEKSVSLAQDTFGTFGSLPVYELPGLKKNDRSTFRNSLHSPYDGSYSLGNTIMKGDGPGTVVPAVQASQPETSSRLISILQTLHSLHRLVLPACISKFESDIVDFHADYTNVFTSGGLEPGATSVQMNVSSLGEDLSTSIGEIQGHWHTDISDDPNRFTLFILLLRVGPTGHPGVFCLARWGLYCAEIGAWILFIAFKGVDLHSGFAPKEEKAAHQAFVDDAELNAAYNMAGPTNRVGYVLYCSKVATHRSGSLNATASTGFGNMSSAHTAKAAMKENHFDFGSQGPSSLGSLSTCANRLAREAVLNLHNSLSLSNLNLKLNLDDLLSNITATNEDDEEITMSPLPYNPQTDATKIQTYRSYYYWHSLECAAIYFRITREDLSNRRRKLAAGNQPNAAESRQKVKLRLATKRSTKNNNSRSHNSNSTESLDDPVLDSSITPLTKKIDLKSIVQVESCYQTADDEMGFCLVLKDCNETVEVTVSSFPELLEHPLVLAYFQSGMRPEWQQTAGTENANNPVSNTLSPSELPSPIIQQNDHTQEEILPESNHVPRLDPASFQLQGSKRPLNEVDLSESEDEREPGDGTVDDELEYEVEDIVEHTIVDSQLVFFVRWKGGETSWVPCENLVPNALTTILNYTSRHDFVLPSDMILASLPTNQSKKAKRTHVDDQRKLLQLADNLKHLVNMLDPAALRKTAHLLERQYDEDKHDRAFWKSANVPNTAVFIDSLAKSSQEGLILDAYLPILTNNNPLSASVINLNLITTSATVLPQTKSFARLAPFLSSAIQAEVCNSWVHTYQWHAKSGDQLACDLMALHQEHGFETLSLKWPQFSRLVDHIVRFLLQTVQNDLESPQNITLASDKRAKHTKDCDHIRHLSSTIPIENIGSLPSHLYNLTTATNSSKLISLDSFKHASKALKFSSWGNIAKEYIYTLHGPCILKEILSAHVVFPSIEKYDIYTRQRTGTRTSTKIEDVYNRAVLRGALLYNLQKACGGNAIFFYAGMSDFVNSPTTVFPRSTGNRYNGSDEKMYAAFFSRNSKQDFQPLLDALYAIIEQYPEIQKHASRIKHVTLQVIHGLAAGRCLCDDDDRFIEDGPRKSKPKAPISLQIPSTLANYQPSADTLAPGNHIGLGTLGLIIREALRHVRSQPKACHEVHQVLLGSNPIQFSGSAPLPLSHTDPIRSFSIYATIFSNNLSPSQLATRAGLSNLLSYMGTGQGSGTLGFLNKMVLKPNKFFAQSLPEITEEFQTAISYNAAIFGATPNASRLAGFMHCFDTRVWGQPSRSFSLSPEGNDKFQGVEHKFEPYWRESVQDKWAAFLGAMLDRDPAKWGGQKPSWTETFHFFVGLQIPGFQTGLTVFQGVNNLALAGICQRPTSHELACWISKHRNLGAWRGLKNLGFLVDDKRGEAIYAAFISLYQFLDQHLPISDKGDLDFGPMFLEHLLCKVARYSHRWTGFVDCAKAVENGSDDISTFSFPLILTKASLQRVLDATEFRNLV